MTEEQALYLLRKRDPEGLNWFIRRYTPYVSAVVWNIIGRAMTREDAEELCSDVFLILWQNADRPRSGKVKSWLGVIARRRAVDRLRERGVELGTDEDMLALPAPGGPDRDAEKKELSRLVRQAVTELPMPDREIFVRFYYYCQTAAAIAEEMDLTPAAVRKRLERGREKLRTYFADKEDIHGISDIL